MEESHFSWELYKTRISNGPVCKRTTKKGKGENR